MAKMGRPRKEIDRIQFEKLCGLQCTAEEIAGFFEMSEDTLNERLKELYDGRTFQDLFKIYRQQGKVSLRRHQFKLAERSASMGIWLGKQFLDQKDDRFAGQNEDLKETEYVILDKEDEKEAEEMLKDFTE